MLRRDFARTTDSIGATDFYKMAMDFRDRQKQKELDANEIMSGYQKGVDMQRQNALADALQSGDPEAINKAAIAYNPQAFYDATQRIKETKEAEDRQFARQKELLDIKNQYDTDAFNRGAALREKLANIRANGNGLVNINMSNPFDKKRIEKAASDMDANIAKAQEMKATFEQANNALQNIKTGTPFAMLTKNRPLLSNADEEAFDSAAAKSIDMVRKAGTGPMTDADARRYEKASIDRGKSKEANQLLIDSGIIAADNAIAREELRAEWVSNGGRLGDFDKKWRNYLNSNPIFGKDGKINKGRQDAFNWFYNPQQQPQNNSVDTNNDPLGLR